MTSAEVLYLAGGYDVDGYSDSAVFSQPSKSLGKNAEMGSMEKEK